MCTRDDGSSIISPSDNVRFCKEVTSKLLTPKQQRLLTALVGADSSIVRKHARLKNLDSEGAIQFVIRRIINHCV